MQENVIEVPTCAEVGEADAAAESGGGAAVIVTLVAPLAVAEAESVTVHVAVNVPEDAYAWVAVDPLPVAPSPKFQANEYGEVPPEAVHVKVIEVPTCAEVGDALADADSGGGAAVIVTEVVPLAVADAESVTVQVAVKFPALEYAWLAVEPEPLLPSPKAHAKL